MKNDTFYLKVRDNKQSFLLMIIDTMSCIISINKICIIKTQIQNIIDALKCIKTELTSRLNIRRKITFNFKIIFSIVR